MELTIINPGKDSVNDPQAVALGALGWLLSDVERAQRFLALTGLTPDDLRAGLQDRAVLNAVFDFLAAHEPDLIGAAESLGMDPGALVQAGKELE